MQTPIDLHSVLVFIIACTFCMRLFQIALLVRQLFSYSLPHLRLCTSKITLGLLEFGHVSSFEDHGRLWFGMLFSKEVLVVRVHRGYLIFKREGFAWQQRTSFRI